MVGRALRSAFQFDREVHERRPPGRVGIAASRSSNRIDSGQRCSFVPFVVKSAGHRDLTRAKIRAASRGLTLPGTFNRNRRKSGSLCVARFQG